MNKKAFFITVLIFASLSLFIKVKHIDESKEYVSENLTITYYDLGYTEDDINYLKQQFSEAQILYLKENNIKKEHFFSYLKHQAFHFDDLLYYEELRKTEDLTPFEAINYYNHPYLTSRFYHEIQLAINIDSDLILVNKNYYLPKSYIPSNLYYTKDINLLLPNDPTRNYLTYDAFNALKELFKEATRQNLMLFLSNGYRSYEKQEQLYNGYLLYENPDLYSARPGHSEHQTGLAVDLTCKAVNFFLTPEFESTPEGKFVKNDAHKYGFIIRYPKNKTHITGYEYEPWHLRYVGKTAAKIIYENGFTLEEYLLKYTDMPK